MNGSTARKKRQLSLNKLLGKRLAELRHAQGLNQEEVARHMDVQRPLISKVENGHHTLDAMEVPDYARALGIQPIELFETIDGIAVEYDGKTQEGRRQR